MLPRLSRAEPRLSREASLAEPSLTEPRGRAKPSQALPFMQVVPSPSRALMLGVNWRALTSKDTSLGRTRTMYILGTVQVQDVQVLYLYFRVLVLVQVLSMHFRVLSFKALFF